MRRPDWSPTTWLALALVGVAALGIAGWFRFPALKPWLPNVTVSALTVAATITIVDRIVQREAARRLQPRFESVAHRIGISFKWLLIGIGRDLKQTQPPGVDAGSLDGLRLTETWLEAQADGRVEREKARRMPDPHDLPALAGYALDFAETLERQRARDREVLRPDLIRAMDDFVKATRDAVALYEMVDRETRSDWRWSVTVLLEAIVTATYEFAVAFARHAPQAILLGYGTGPDRG